MIDRNLHDRLFADYDRYAFSFADSTGKLLEMQELKFAHSHRVAETARAIATGENWRPADILLADVVGLYHDVARYRQYKDYRTFQDYRSINHGEAGWEILREKRFLRDLGAEDEEVACLATRYHNAKDLQGGLTERQLRFLLLVRDSDKIDIYHVLYENIKSGAYLKFPEIYHGVDPHGAVSPKILAGVRAGVPQLYGDARSISDFLLIAVQWLNDFHFATSRKILRERQVVDKIAEIIQLTPEVEEVLETARRNLD